MTRITSFGRKRTYVEAGFDPEPSDAPAAPTIEPKASGRKPLPSQADALEVAEEAAAAASNGAPIARKHPKRHRPNKKKKVEGDAQESVEAEVKGSAALSVQEPHLKKQKKPLKKRRGTSPDSACRPTNAQVS
jgi:hypothetical protein